jgi:hypothetical protein
MLGLMICDHTARRVRGLQLARVLRIRTPVRGTVGARLGQVEVDQTGSRRQLLEFEEIADATRGERVRDRGSK